jgi:hypothetical protein
MIAERWALEAAVVAMIGSADEVNASVEKN